MTVVTAGKECNGAGDQNSHVENNIASSNLCKPLSVQRVDKTVEDSQGSLYTDSVVGCGYVSSVRSERDSSEQDSGGSILSRRNTTNLTNQVQPASDPIRVLVF